MADFTVNVKLHLPKHRYVIFQKNIFLGTNFHLDRLRFSTDIFRVDFFQVGFQK